MVSFAIEVSEIPGQCSVGEASSLDRPGRPDQYSLHVDATAGASFAVLAIVLTGCDWPDIAPPGAAPVRYRDQVFNSVTVTSNLTYGSAVNLEGQTIPLQLDMYQLATPSRLVRRLSGSMVARFCCGDKTSAELVDEATFSKEGYLNVSINYRPESPGCSGSLSNCGPAIDEAAADAQTAVRFLRTHATTYRIDPNRVAIAGSSAGAITALNVGYSSSEDPSARVRAAVSLSGSQLLVGTISPGDAPALDFHCTTDPLVPYSPAVNTINAAQAQGLDAFLVSWNETCHVPYTEHRQQILDQSRNFLWWEMDLTHAAT
jgi:predicted esterase